MNQLNPTGFYLQWKYKEDPKETTPLENKSGTMNLEVINRKNDARLRFLNDFRGAQDSTLRHNQDSHSSLNSNGALEPGTFNLSQTEDGLGMITRMVSDYRV